MGGCEELQRFAIQHRTPEIGRELVAFLEGFGCKHHGLFGVWLFG
jgi:hypothetical protein